MGPDFRRGDTWRERETHVSDIFSLAYPLTRSSGTLSRKGRGDVGARSCHSFLLPLREKVARKRRMRGEEKKAGPRLKAGEDLLWD